MILGSLGETHHLTRLNPKPGDVGLGCASTMIN
jgi:hypothetical protein